MQPSYLNNILVIDEVPTIAWGLQEIFRPLGHSIRVEHIENIFTALSSRSYEGKSWDLIIIGDQTDSPSENLYRSANELRKRFGNPRIMVYSNAYDPVVIEKMPATGIDAYVHKYEPVEEIRKAYIRLGKGESYISEIFHTLYYEYGQGVEK